jgi:hypothetical protein
VWLEKVKVESEREIRSGGVLKGAPQHRRAIEAEVDLVPRDGLGVLLVPLHERERIRGPVNLEFEQNNRAKFVPGVIVDAVAAIGVSNGSVTGPNQIRPDRLNGRYRVHLGA